MFIITPKVVESESKAEERRRKCSEILKRLVTEFSSWWEEAKRELKEMYASFQQVDIKKTNKYGIGKENEFIL